MATKQSPPAPDGAPERFFEKELAGADSPGLDTMRELYNLSGELYGLRPWELIGKSQPVLVGDPDTEDQCVCSVLGASGKVLALKVETGDKRRLSAQFVRLGKLTRPDREFLAHMGHPLQPGKAAPMFRSAPAGSPARYITEQEARILIECTRAVNLICRMMRTGPALGLWSAEGDCPLVVRKAGSATQFEVCLVKAP